MKIIAFKILPKYITTETGVYTQGQIVDETDSFFNKISKSKMSYKLPGEDKPEALYEAIVEVETLKPESLAKAELLVENPEASNHNPEEESLALMEEASDDSTDETSEDEASRPKRRKQR